MIIFVVIVGIFYGYVYGEVIIGVEMILLLVYLMGFIVI